MRLGLILKVAIFTVAMNATTAFAQTAVFYVPHQDDEVLSLAVAITNHLWEGADVHVVLYTEGTPSNFAFNTVNGNRSRLGFSRLTRTEISNARTAEFTRASLALGVKLENIHIDPIDLSGDRSLDLRQMRRLILKYNRLLGEDVDHRAMSYRDMASDHNVSGAALLGLYNRGRILTTPRFYARLVQQDERTFARERGAAFVIAGTFETVRDEYLPRIRDAVRPYVFEPSIERNDRSRTANRIRSNSYRFNHNAFGQESVGTSRFRSARNNPRSKFHLANE